MNAPQCVRRIKDVSNYRFILQWMEKRQRTPTPANGGDRDATSLSGLKKVQNLENALGAFLCTFQRLTCYVVPQRAGHAQIIASRQNLHLDQLPVTGHASDRQEDRTPAGGGYQHPRRCAAHPHCVSDGGLRPRHKVAPNFPFGSSSVAVSAWGRLRKRKIKHVKDYWRPESSDKA